MKRLVILLAALLSAGCPDTTKTPTRATPAGPQTAEEAQRLHAQKAAQALGKRLKAHLGKALQDGGPAGGIAACKVAAPSLTAFEGVRHRVRIGRTSFKLRNPKNIPPPWAKAWVEQKTATPQFSAAEDGTLRALLPIKLEALCTTCHGDPAQISPEVKAALAKDYPNDRATGFKPGDLRGWFWVEVPRPKKS